MRKVYSKIKVDHKNTCPLLDMLFPGLFTWHTQAQFCFHMQHMQHVPQGLCLCLPRLRYLSNICWGNSLRSAGANEKMTAYILLNGLHAHMLAFTFTSMRSIESYLQPLWKNTRETWSLSGLPFPSTSQNIPRGSFPHQWPLWLKNSQLDPIIKALVSASMGLALMLVCKLLRAPPLREKQ